MTAVGVASEHDRAAAELVAIKQALYDAWHRAGELAEAGNLHRSDARAVMRAQVEVDSACNDFRRRFYPRAARVICALGCVTVVGPYGRLRIVFDEQSRRGA